MICQRLVAEQSHASFKAQVQEEVPVLADGDPCGLELRSLECISFEGDATNQEAVQKDKVYMGRATILNITKTNIANTGDAFELCPTVTVSLCDLQTVKLGTTAELRGMVFKQLWGVGQDTWCDRANTIPLCDTFTIYVFALDKCPENVGVHRRL